MQEEMQDLRAKKAQEVDPTSYGWLQKKNRNPLRNPSSGETARVH